MGRADTNTLLVCGALLLCAVVSVAALNNGQALTPVLGYNTWNCFATDIDEDIIRATADRMVELGLKDVGYSYLNIDDAWSEPERVGGRLVGNKQAFPSGMKAIGEYIHSKGLKFGIYGDAGSHTCAGYPGSRGYEEVDAQTWAEWGVDYLKFDNCFAPAEDWVIDRYVAMRDALNRTGRPIVYSLCEWGVADPWLWAPEVGNSWRTTEDISASWQSILNILDMNAGLARFSGPGAWGDADMLEVGNGKLTLGEQRAHFALWALYKSPLLIGADLRRINPDSLAILKAKEVIAINQDALGIAGDLIWAQGAKRIYAGPLAGGARAVVFLNLHTTGGQYLLSNITVAWEQLGLPAATQALVRDLYAEQDLGQYSGAFTATVAAHDVVVLRITPLGGPRGDDGWRPWQQQPIYAMRADDVAPQRTDFFRAGQGRGEVEQVQGHSDGGGRKLVPGGQHPMFT